MNARSPRMSGFTLIEMIAVMTISALLAVAVWYAISGPLRGFVDLSRRAILVDHGEAALLRMSRELRLALPNSVRVTPDGAAVEFLRTAWGGRYRGETDPALPGSKAFNLAATKDTFDILDVSAAVNGIRSGGNLGACLAGNVDCVVMYNTGQPADCSAQSNHRTNAYCGDNAAGLAAFNPVAGTIGFDRSDAGTPLPFPSPAQRIYIVDTPVSFACASQFLKRYSNYPIATTQASAPSANAALLATEIESCSFTYDPGDSSRAGLVTINLVLASTNLDGVRESVTLAQQVPISNVP